MKIWARTDVADRNLYITDPTQTPPGEMMVVPFKAAGWTSRSKLSSAPVPGARFQEITSNKANLLALVGAPATGPDGQDPNGIDNAQSTGVYGGRRTIYVPNNNCTATQLGLFVKLSATGTATIITATTDVVAGVLTGLDTTTAASQAEITVCGRVTVSSNSGGIAPGDRLTYTNAGVPIKMAGTDFIQSLGVAGSSTGRHCVGVPLAVAAGGAACDVYCFEPRPMIA